MMDFLLRGGRYTIQTAGPLLFVYRSGKPNAERLASLDRFVTGFLRSLPRTLVNEERERRGLPPALDAGSAAEHHRYGEGEA
jgi:hypothetical protein